jgi:hypothetical protein
VTLKFGVLADNGTDAALVVYNQDMVHGDSLPSGTEGFLSVVNIGYRLISDTVEDPLLA